MGGTNGSPLSALEAYDPASDTWTARAAMPTARQALAAGVVSGKLYALGGWNAVLLSAVEEYDPVTDTWAARAAMSTARYQLAAGVLAGRLYAVGGSTGVPVAVVEEYDPSGDVWTTKAPMPTARGYLAAVVASGRMYALGGSDAVTQVATVDEYDPAANVWTAKTAMQIPRNGMAAGMISNRLLAAGGYNSGGNVSGLERGVLGLVPGASLTFTLTGQVGALCAPTAVSNTAWVSGGFACQTSVQQTNATGFAVTPPAVSLVTSQALTPTVPGRGGEVRYQIVVQNTGAATITSLVLTDTIPTAIPR
ncbi:MAG: hypothetical protein AAB368_08590, partial [bacterium]